MDFSVVSRLSRHTSKWVRPAFGLYKNQPNCDLAAFTRASCPDCAKVQNALIVNIKGADLDQIDPNLFDGFLLREVYKVDENFLPGMEQPGKRLPGNVCRVSASKCLWLILTGVWD